MQASSGGIGTVGLKTCSARRAFSDSLLSGTVGHVFGHPRRRATTLGVYAGHFSKRSTSKKWRELKYLL